MSERDFSEKMPATIGRYQVQESVGFGAMGAVYKAFDPLIKRTLAIKTIRLDIPKQSSQYQSFIERFYHEARISGTLSHPNIVTLFDIGEEHGIPYLAMEYVPGETVSQLLEKATRFAPERVVSIVSQVASAVDYAHGRGVVHRDIKPSNIILHDGDKVKVTDFGIAKLANADMTQSGTLLGTPSYMSPEQAMGEKVDGRSDIFSLGVCAYEMLSSQQPFPGSNVTSILYKLVHDEPQVPPDLETNGLVPDKWREVFSKVLAKKPVDRYETARAFVADLEYCLASWFGSLSEATLIGPAPSKVRATMVTAATATVPPPVPPDASVTVVKRPDKISTAPIVVNPTLQIPPDSEAPAPPSPNDDVTIATPPPSAKPEAPAAHGSSPDAPDAARSTATEPVTLISPGSPSTASTPASSRLSDDKTLMAPRPAPTGPVAGKQTSKTTPSSRGMLPLLLLGAGAIAVLAVLGIWFARRSAIPEPTPTPPVVEATPTPLPSVAAAVVGTIHVESQPNGAAVLLNGEARGNTPLDLADIPLGDHTVRIDMRGYESLSQTVTLSADAVAAQVKATLTRRSPTMASLDISSQPLGADVSVDGGIVGRTPILGMKLRPGNYRVEVRREGFENFSTTVRAEAGKKASVDAVLKAVSGPAATPPPTASQAPPSDPNAIFSTEEVDTRPVRVSGQTASYPSGKLPRLRQGQAVSVTVSYVVSETGEVSDPKITESGGAVLDDEVLKAVRGFRYTPGQKGGRPVKVRMSFKQTFRGA